MVSFARLRQFRGAARLELPILGVDGAEWRNHGRFYVPRWVSALYALQPGRSDREIQDYLAWAISTGFDGVRMFAGELLQVNQSAAFAKARLPQILDITAQAGVALELTALNGTAARTFDPESYVYDLAQLVRPYKHVVLGLSNEIDHSSQDARITPEVLLRWGRLHCSGLVWSAGAMLNQDEPALDGSWPPAGAPYNSAHLNRGRIDWERERRIRELHAIVERTRAVCLNREPLGAADIDGSISGKQRSDQPALFATMGSLDRGFPGVGGVHHNQSGLEVIVPGPQSPLQRCADAYIAAWRFTDECLEGQPGSYRNSGGSESPVGMYSDAVWAHDIVRHYSFERSDKAVCPMIGTRDGVVAPWKNGYAPTGRTAEFPGPDGRSLKLIEVRR